MNSRQKAGVSLGITGVVSLALGILIGSTVDTPAWVDLVLKVLGTLFPLIGLTVNLPSNTNPK